MYPHSFPHAPVSQDHPECLYLICLLNTCYISFTNKGENEILLFLLTSPHLFQKQNCVEIYKNQEPSQPLETQVIYPICHLDFFLLSGFQYYSRCKECICSAWTRVKRPFVPVYIDCSHCVSWKHSIRPMILLHLVVLKLFHFFLEFWGFLFDFQ